MSIAAKSTSDRFVTWTDWDGYLQFYKLLEDRRVKITYDRGMLELLSPSLRHERTKTIIRALLECLMEEAGVDFEGGGSTTFRRVAQDRGFEPDECYWIVSVAAVRAADDMDPEAQPAPDLAVEVEVTRSVLDRLGIYLALGVPEVWRWTSRGHLKVLRLTPPGEYKPSPHSLAFPWLPLKVFEDHVHTGLDVGQMAAVRRFRAWLREHCPTS